MSERNKLDKGQINKKQFRVPCKCSEITTQVVKKVPVCTGRNQKQLSERNKLDKGQINKKQF